MMDLRSEQKRRRRKKMGEADVKAARFIFE
jgi:hypothetical protein